MSQINDSLLVQGNLTVTGSFTPPPNSITTAAFAAAAESRLEATKQVHRHRYTFALAATEEPVNKTQLLGMSLFAGQIKHVRTRHQVAPTADANTTINLRKNGASVLASGTPIDLNAAAGTNVQAGSITTIDYVAGDVFDVVITASAGAGAKGQGLIIELEVEEQPV